MSVSTELAMLKVSDIDFSAIALRTHKPDSDDIKELANDILERGIQNPFSVVPSATEGKFTITDGSRRLTALKLLETEGLLGEVYPDGAIPVQVKEVKDDIQILCDQLAGNAQIKKTGDRDYINGIFLIASSGEYSLEEIGKLAGMTPDYILKLFKILKIPENHYNRIKEEGISVGNTISISKLAGKVSDDEVDEFIDLAKTETTGKFAETVEEKLNQIKKGTSGRGAKKEFKLVAKLLKRDQLKIFLVNARTAFEELNENADPVEVAAVEARFQLMKEIWQIDEVSEKEQRDKFEADEQRRKDNAKKRKADRDSKKLEDSINDLKEKGFTITPPKAE